MTAEQINMPPAPLAIILLTLNEAHNMHAVLKNIRGLAQEVFLVDSFSTDDTVKIAEAYGVTVVKRKFQNFGDQWNFAVSELPISAPWTMKLDPDESLTPDLIASIRAALSQETGHTGFDLTRRLWFLGAPMPVRHSLLRIWRTGSCRFSDVLVNEYPIVEGSIGHLDGDLEHHDSPDLHHWFEKQNRYTTLEALTRFENRELAAPPRLMGNALERRMWFKTVYGYLPFRHKIMFLYCYFWLGAWRSGKPGFAWARLRTTVFQMIDDKLFEMQRNAQSYDTNRRIQRRGKT